MDCFDYEHIRNLTLMFFLDRLMDKGQPRSLHDLSCQFGTKGFTKEMRQVAGGSESGLRKFLLQYPSLFTIQDDQVYITHMVCQDSKKERRDYTKEAGEYFRCKLEQYGEAEVPLKSLFGHRSQAPPEIRYVSGQNANEFKSFLEKIPSIFVVTDGYVVLRSVLERTGPNGEQLTLKRVPEEVSIDPYLMQQLVALLESVIFTTCQKDGAKSVSLSALFHYMIANNQNELWSKMVNNVNDLCTLLKMNSKSFCVQSTNVSLTPEREELLKAGESVTKRIGINDYNNSKSMLNSTNNNNNSIVSKITTTTDSNSKNSNNTTYHSAGKNSNISHELTNDNANVKSANSLPCLPATQNPPKIHLQNRTVTANSLHMRIKTQIIKALAENSLSTPHRNGNVHSFTTTSHLSDSAILRTVKIITRVKDADEIVKELIDKNSIIAVDCGGGNSSSSSVLTMVTVAIMPAPSYNQKVASLPKIYIFDLQFDPNIVKGPLKRLLESPNVIKVFHDCRNDSLALYYHYGIMLQNVFDSQVGHALLQQQNYGKPVYKSKFVSLQSLLESYIDASFSPRKETAKRNTRRDQKYWIHRPFTDEMILLVAYNVYPLVPDIYLTMRKQIRPEYNELLEQLNKEAILFKIKPDEVKSSKRSRKIEMEVAYLKQKLYNVESKQVVLSNREIRLLRFIDMTDEIKAKVEGSHKVARKLERFSKKQDDTNEDNSANMSDSFSDDNNSDDEQNNSDPFDHAYGSSESNQSQDYCESTLEKNNNTNGSNQLSTKSPNSFPFITTKSDCSTNTLSCCSCSSHPSYYNGEKNIADSAKNFVDASIQTLSTGDVIITKVFLPDAVSGLDSVLDYDIERDMT